MKNLSLILNGILAIAVGILFFQVNALKNGQTPVASSNNEVLSSDTTKSKVLLNEVGPTTLADTKMAFINIDSINSRYLYIADYSKKMRGQMESLEAQLESLKMNVQNEYMAYEQSAQTGIAPQAELAKMEESIKRKDQEMKNKQLQLQNLQYDQQDKIIELNTKLQQVVDKFNNGRFDYVISYSEALPILAFKNRKLDISAEVIEILNAEYIATKGKAKK
jgi:outer membrane protein